MKIKQRIATYNTVATELALLSNKQLMELLEQARPIGVSIGGTTALLEIDGKQVFIKKIRLTDIERQADNIMSTANVFELPFYYHYGIGSAGFGAWRELSSHVMSTNWVIAGECHHFPLMYLWRVLPASKLNSSAETTKKLNDDVRFWGESLAIRERLESSQNASAEIVLFLEYFPENVHDWLAKELKKNAKSAESACSMVEKNLLAVTSFMNAQGLLHFDAHFGNILTDGENLYFSDFGLAISSRFDLSKAEMDFFKEHRLYDQCYATYHLAKWLLIECFGDEGWKIVLQEYIEGKMQRKLPPYISEIIARNYNSLVVMHDFFEALKAEPKTTRYPFDKIKRIFSERIDDQNNF